MIRFSWYLTLSLCLLAGCVGREAGEAVIDEPVVAIDPSRESEGGIGGTGAPTRQQAKTGGEDAEGGIGGTGIFGTVTAFGSIVVNGLTVDFSDNVIRSQVSSVGQDLPLTVGAAVLVEAGRTGEDWIASSVSLFLPIVGPVSSVDAASGILEVMGTPIVMDEGVELLDRSVADIEGPLALSAINPGDRLAVSGIWKGGEVIASRIDRLTDGVQASLRGLLLKTGDGAIVGGTRLADGCCEDLASPAFVDLLGRYHDGQFDVLDLQAGAELLFSKRIDQLVVEAFLARDPDGEGFHLSGFGIPADQSATLATEPGVRSLFVGRYDDAFQIQDSVALPADRSARIHRLQSIDNITFSD